jgi:hypothetical protein
MVWPEIVKEIAVLVVEEAAAAIIDEFTGNELQEAFDDAIEEIRLSTRRIIEESKHEELQAILAGLVNSLREYKVAPTIMQLELITHDCRVFLLDQLKTLDLYDPDGRGLMGHPDFLLAAGLYMAILQERVVAIDEANKQNLVNFLSESIDHAEHMHGGWQEWNEKRFGSVFFTVSRDSHTGISTYLFWYTFDGKWIDAGVSFVRDLDDLVGLGSPSERAEQAEYQRQQHIAGEWEKLESEFVVPSIEVVKMWRSLLAKMKIEMKFSESQMVLIGPGDELRKKLLELNTQHLAPKPKKP